MGKRERERKREKVAGRISSSGIIGPREGKNFFARDIYYDGPASRREPTRARLDGITIIPGVNCTWQFDVADGA